LVGAAVLAIALALIGGAALRHRPPAGVCFSDADLPREQWTMPPVALLSRPRLSAPRRAALVALGGYMVVALVMLLVKSVQLAGG
jgi:hypothetical protein